MNIEMLNDFVAVAETGSFTSAAKNLYISPQGLNKMVTSMEDELGYQLVNRTKRGTALTESGRIFLKHARVLLRDYDAMLEDLASGDYDRQFLLEAPYRIAATTLCIERIVRPLEKMGLLGDITLREVTLDNALEVSREAGWLALVDIPTYVEPKPDSLEGGALLELADVKMGVVYNADKFPGISKNPTAGYVSQFPLGIIDAPTMRDYASSIFNEDALSNNMRYLTRQYSILGDAAEQGKAVILFDSLSWSQREHAGDRGTMFTQIEDHTCKLGFLHYADVQDPGKRRYVHSFQRIFQSTAKQNGWNIS